MPRPLLHPVIDGMKICSRKDCTLAGVPQPVASFPERPKLKYGIGPHCKSCASEGTRRWQRGHPDTVRKIAARTRAGTTYKKWRLENKERLNRQVREWRIVHPEEVRRYKLNPYGATPEWYDQQLAAQGGCCAICGSTDPKSGGDFAIDHDHRCCDKECQACDNCRRGLLCNPCNTRLGALENHGSLGEQTRLTPAEKKAWVRKAMAYIHEHAQMKLFELPLKKPVRRESTPTLHLSPLPEVVS